MTASKREHFLTLFCAFIEMIFSEVIGTVILATLATQ